MKYKYLEHTADAKFQAFGKTLEEAFENSAFAMLKLMYNAQDIKARKEKRISVKGRDLEALLYNWLEELLFLLDSQNFLAGGIKGMKITKKEKGYELEAKVSGDDALTHKSFRGVKAVTYNEMFIKKDKGKFIIQVVVDM